MTDLDAIYAAAREAMLDADGEAIFSSALIDMLVNAAVTAALQQLKKDGWRIVKWQHATVDDVPGMLFITDELEVP